MNFWISLLPLVFGIALGQSVQKSTCPDPADIKGKNLTCLEIIRKLSLCDKCLDSRLDTKNSVGKSAKNADEFVSMMKGNVCNGTDYNCGHTRSYVAEVFQGLRAQYDESKYNDEISAGANKAGMYQLRKKDLRKVFESMANSPNTIIHWMRHSGTHDHVWLVEQLPNGQGYRLYQSYHDGYSLRAWIADDVTGLYNADNGDIMLFRTVQKMVDDAIKQATNGSASLKNYEMLRKDPVMKNFMPFVDFVAAYNESQAMAYFTKAWNKFGKGQILTKTVFMNEFVSRLGDLVEYFENHGSDDASGYSQDIWNKWAEIYGGPDPTYYPGVPNNGVMAMMGRKPKYMFQMRNVIVTGKPQCEKNALVILGQ